MITGVRVLHHSYFNHAMGVLIFFIDACSSLVQRDGTGSNTARNTRITRAECAGWLMNSFGRTGAPPPKPYLRGHGCVPRRTCYRASTKRRETKSDVKTRGQKQTKHRGEEDTRGGETAPRLLFLFCADGDRPRSAPRRHVTAASAAAVLTAHVRRAHRSLLTTRGRRTLLSSHA